MPKAASRASSFSSSSSSAAPQTRPVSAPSSQGHCLDGGRRGGHGHHLKRLDAAAQLTTATSKLVGGSTPDAAAAAAATTVSVRIVSSGYSVLHHGRRILVGPSVTPQPPLPPPSSSRALSPRNRNPPTPLQPSSFFHDPTHRGDIAHLSSAPPHSVAARQDVDAPTARRHPPPDRAPFLLSPGSYRPAPRQPPYSLCVGVPCNSRNDGADDDGADDGGDALDETSAPNAVDASSGSSLYAPCDAANEVSTVSSLPPNMASDDGRRGGDGDVSPGLLAPPASNETTPSSVPPPPPYRQGVAVPCSGGGWWCWSGGVPWGFEPHPAAATWWGLPPTMAFHHPQCALWLPDGPSVCTCSCCGATACGESTHWVRLDDTLTQCESLTDQKGQTAAAVSSTSSPATTTVVVHPQQQQAPPHPYDTTLGPIAASWTRQQQTSPTARRGGKDGRPAVYVNDPYSLMGWSPVSIAATTPSTVRDTSPSSAGGRAAHSNATSSAASSRGSPLGPAEPLCTSSLFPIRVGDHHSLSATQPQARVPREGLEKGEDTVAAPQSPMTSEVSGVHGATEQLPIDIPPPLPSTCFCSKNAIARPSPLLLLPVLAAAVNERPQQHVSTRTLAMLTSNGGEIPSTPLAAVARLRFSSSAVVTVLPVTTAPPSAVSSTLFCSATTIDEDHDNRCCEGEGSGHNGGHPPPPSAPQPPRRSRHIQRSRSETRGGVSSIALPAWPMQAGPAGEYSRLTSDGALFASARVRSATSPPLHSTDELCDLMQPRSRHGRGRLGAGALQAGVQPFDAEDQTLRDEEVDDRYEEEGPRTPPASTTASQWLLANNTPSPLTVRKLMDEWDLVVNGPHGGEPSPPPPQGDKDEAQHLQVALPAIEDIVGVTPIDADSVEVFVVEAVLQISGVAGLYVMTMAKTPLPPPSSESQGDDALSVESAAAAGSLVGVHVLVEGDRGVDMAMVTRVALMGPATAATVNLGDYEGSLGSSIEEGDPTQKEASQTVRELGGGGGKPLEHHQLPLACPTMTSPTASGSDEHDPKGQRWPHRRVLRRATPNEVAYYYHHVVPRSLECFGFVCGLRFNHQVTLACDVAAMHFLSCEFQFDMKRLTVYFAAPRVVRFHNLARVLHRRFGHCRVWIFQVNRDAAAASERQARHHAASAAGQPQHLPRQPEQDMLLWPSASALARPPWGGGPGIYPSSGFAPSSCGGGGAAFSSSSVAAAASYNAAQRPLYWSSSCPAGGQH